MVCVQDTVRRSSTTHGCPCIETHMHSLYWDICVLCLCYYGCCFLCWLGVIDDVTPRSYVLVCSLERESQGAILVLYNQEPNVLNIPGVITLLF